MAHSVPRFQVAGMNYGANYLDTKEANSKQQQQPVDLSHDPPDRAPRDIDDTVAVYIDRRRRRTRCSKHHHRAGGAKNQLTEPIQVGAMQHWC